MMRDILGWLFLMTVAIPHRCLCLGATGGGTRCIESERRALLEIKEDIFHPGNWLSSWRTSYNDSSAATTDCCSWQGVGCDPGTGHVIKLDLRYPYDKWYSVVTGLPQGPSKLNPSLLTLMHLKYLDLSMNDFSRASIPEFIGSLQSLEYLNLSWSEFSGVIPNQLGNLSCLQFLDLSSFDLRVVDGHRWISTLPSLKHLHMEGVNLSEISDHWIDDINMLPSLSVLSLPFTGLRSISITIPHVNFTSLSFLDLSSNTDMTPSAIPLWLSNMSSLVTLNLNTCNFCGELPSFTGISNNWQSLWYLDLSENRNIDGEITEVLQNLTSLVYLDLGANHISGCIPYAFSNLTQLEYLDLSGNQITGPIPEIFDSLVQLEHLDLADNAIGGHIRHALSNFTRSIKYLDLSGNNISGVIPEIFDKLVRMEHLDLSSNIISGELPKATWRLCNLVTLRLSGNKISGEITSLIEGLSECNENNNKLHSGSDQHVLREMYLENNDFNGTIPEVLGQISSLEFLSLSSNSFQGSLTEAHFTNLSNLVDLDISNNQFDVILSQSWIPPFNLNRLGMCSCNLGPKFPSWLQNQTQLGDLCISEAGISDTFPDWLWHAYLYYLNVSNNQFKGHLPLSLNLNKYQYALDLSSNSFDGHLPNLLEDYGVGDGGAIILSNNSFSGAIPMTWFTSTNTRHFLSLSHNYLNGSIPLSFCDISSLKVLDLSNNILSGELPFCQSNQSQLTTVDLSSNLLSGPIPYSIGSLTSLQSLHLRNNKLSGKIPRSLKLCQQLVILDLGENKLSGNVPKWIGGSLSSLKVLRLRSNSFTGNVPRQLSRLTSLQVLDLAHNNLSGSLSLSFENFTAMIAMHTGGSKPKLSNTSDSSPYYKENLMITAKGLTVEYTSVLSLVTSIDLSNNRLSGEIPDGVTFLAGLHFLNLSANCFSGSIPEKIGVMVELESLDLSMNGLSGNIPSRMSTLHFLSRLNLSNNDLSGRIPSGDQLQTFDDPSIYNGNRDLCGWPLPLCVGGEPTKSPPDMGGTGDEKEIIWIYIGAALGFVVGFWGLVGTLMIKNSLRIMLFRWADNSYDWIYVALALRAARLKSCWD